MGLEHRADLDAIAGATNVQSRSPDSVPGNDAGRMTLKPTRTGSQMAVLVAPEDEWKSAYRLV
ncbi:protein of unknown function [Cupriavidus taiwanensis]|nr:protein of unknown function [Cupriavidus taiwanensis]